MSTATLDYFHSVSLRQRYLHGLDDAVRRQRLSALERSWLQGLVRAPVAHDPDPIRADRLTLNGLDQPLELAAALLLSHGGSDDRQVYLFTLAGGVERFGDRHTLLAALRVRFFDGEANALFEAEVIEGDPFEAQMLAIVEQQVDDLDQLSTQLKLTPTVQHATTASLARQLRVLLPHRSIDGQTHLLQVVPEPNSDDVEPLALTQTLAQAAFDDYCKVGIAHGMRRFIDEQGQPSSPDDSHLFAQALAAAAASVEGQYADLLKVFWAGTWRGRDTRRELAMHALNASVRQALYRFQHDGSLGPATFRELLTLLQTRSGELPSSTAVRCHRLALRVGDSASCALAGIFALGVGADRSVLVFSVDHRFVRFADVASLARYVATAEGRAHLRPALALQDQSILLREGLLTVELQRIDAPLFADRVDSILTLQARNLVYVTGLPGAFGDVAAMIDDALDVRQLLDPRQSQFAAGRWRQEAPFDFAEVWLTARALPAAPVQSSPMIDRGAEASPVLPPSWRQQTQGFDQRAERLQGLDNALLGCAAQALQPWLCVMGNGPLHPAKLRMQWLESAPVDASDVETQAVPVSEAQRLVSMDLVSLLLECVSGHRRPMLPVGAQVVAPSSVEAGHLPITLINHMLVQATMRFTEHYVEAFRESRLAPLRQGDRQVLLAREALSLRQQAMRLDLALGRRQGRIDEACIDMVRQVLSRPLRALRVTAQSALAEVYAVSLTYGEQQAAASLCDTLVLRQPLKPGSAVLLWSGESGWRQFSSLQRLEDILQRKLQGADRQRWLQLMGEGDRRLLRAHLLDPSGTAVRLRLDRIDGHALQTLQQRVLDRQQHDLRQLCLRAMRCRFEAGLFSRMAAAIEVDAPLNLLLDGVAVRVDNSLFEALLPAWLTSASLADLRLYYDLLMRYYLLSDGGKDFLFDIPTVQDHARDRLVGRLSQDFPAQQWNPDQVTITSRRYVSAFPPVGQAPSAVAAATVVHSESLTDYAINRFVEDQDAALSVESVAQPYAVRLLTPNYLRSLVRRLDIGSSYRALLRKALTPDDVNFVTRKRLFLEQLAPMLLILALPLKLNGQLSARAFAFISRVFDMPDGIAREPVDGVRVIISALQLVADAGMSPDPVAGVYLICPANPDEGPVILLALHHASFTFRDYSDQAALLAQVRTDEALQALLLQRLDPQLHRRYAYGGFSEPHLPFSVEGSNDLPFARPGPVTLQLAEVKGNVLQLLFGDTVRLLLDLGGGNAVTNLQADQAGRRFLATLGVEQVLSLLPGKLAALVTLWQSQTLFRASAISASGRHWGKALSEFSAALGVMVTAREQAIDEQAPEDRFGGAPGTGKGQGERPAFSWHNTALSAEQRLRLQALEAKNVALEQMRHDQLLNLYLDKDDGTPYAVVDGKVYRVRHALEDGNWTIVGTDGTAGPRLVIDGNQRWQLDLSLRLNGGGALVTKINANGAQHSAEEGLVIEARGMPEIRRLYRDRARRIAQAHLQARLYLENSLDNLNVNRRGAALDPRVTGIIGDFFGVATPGQALLTQIENAIKTLFDALMDPTLSPLSSPRFVVGSNRPGRESIAAFIIKVDPERRVFLTEQFFQVSRYGLSPQAAAQGFESSVHHRAAILLHELSHQALDTHDIAYLETMAPYPDLLLADNAEHLRLKAHIERLQDYRLTHRTQKASLFKLNENGTWRDIVRKDERIYSTILSETQTDSLNDARDVFLSDADSRSRVMLSNADSVTLLILRLGRHSFVASSP